MNLMEISFPVYRLGNNKPHEDNGIVYYLLSTKVDNIIESKILFIDDTNIKQSTLAKRRLVLQTTTPNNFFKIKTAIFFFADLIKIAKKKDMWFIDSNGKVFTYNKTKIVPLIFKPIKQIINIPTGGSIIEVDIGRFKTLFTVDPINKYAGFLKVSPLSYILYGVYKVMHSNTKRKI